MLGDRPTQPRDYSTIEKIAEHVRLAGRITNHSNFNIVEFIEGVFRLKLRAALEVRLFDTTDYAVPAFVKMLNNGKSVELYVEKSVWALAAAGFGLQRYILAHEIGHIMLHSHDILAWSENVPSWVQYLPATERTEPQANLFADMFLVPAHLINGFPDADAIAEYFNVPIQCAQRRFEVVLAKKKHLGYRDQTGEVCPKCANFSLRRAGLNAECEVCGLMVNPESAAKA